MSMPDEELAAIRARVDAATPGPWHGFRKWRVEVWDAGDNQVADIGYIGGDTSDDDRSQMEADTSFIAAARTDIPRLLAEVERLREREAAMREIVQAVAKEDALWYDEYAKHCAFCDNALDPRIRDRIYHADDCPVTKARTILAAEDAQE